MRLRAPAAKTIAADAARPAGQPAFDPIAGGGACATAAGPTSRARPPTGCRPGTGRGYTLLGSPTVIAGIAVAGPELPARRAAARRRTRRLRRRSSPAASTGPGRRHGDPQVFQLHANGWRFAAGHVAQARAAPADAPYGRASNGQLPITVSDLELRLPVAEQPGTGPVRAPAPKVVPNGYAVAPGYTP